MAHPRYRCLAFDVVGTLIHPVPPVAEAYHRVARRFGSRLAAHEIARRFERAFVESEQTDAGREPSSRLVTSEIREKERWRQIVAAVIDDIVDPSSCFDELFTHFARAESWSCFEEVAVVLPALRAAGYRMAIASNFDSRLHGVCDGFAALRDIELRVISSEIGWRKPSRGFYDGLVARAGCQPGELIMVGDDPVNDIEGARQAGLSALFINRRGRPGPGEIGSLVELLELLAPA